MTSMDNILNRVASERLYQDARWGGPEHDDKHLPVEWIGFINEYLGQAAEISSRPGVTTEEFVLEFQDAMIKIAALAVAATEFAGRYVEDTPLV